MTSCLNRFIMDVIRKALQYAVVLFEVKRKCRDIVPKFVYKELEECIADCSCVSSTYQWQAGAFLTVLIP